MSTGEAWSPEGEAGCCSRQEGEWVPSRGGSGHPAQACALLDAVFLCFFAARGELGEEAQPLADLSDGEADFMRPGEEDADNFREEGEYGREEFRFDNIDQQGEPELGGGGRGHTRWPGWEYLFPLTPTLGPAGGRSLSPFCELTWDPQGCCPFPGAPATLPRRQGQQVPRTHSLCSLLISVSTRRAGLC